jgi:hypothetical protein
LEEARLAATCERAAPAGSLVRLPGRIDAESAEILMLAFIQGSIRKARSLNLSGAYSAVRITVAANPMERRTLIAPRAEVVSHIAACRIVNPAATPVTSLVLREVPGLFMLLITVGCKLSGYIRKCVRIGPDFKQC